MGIRFRCHHCDHELHVKDFQGGRRGKCPLCDGRFRIPLQDAEYSLHAEQKVGVASHSGTARPSQTGQPTESSHPSTIPVAAGQEQQADEDSEVTASDAQRQPTGSDSGSSEASETKASAASRAPAESAEASADSAASQRAVANDSLETEAEQAGVDHPEKSSTDEESADESTAPSTEPISAPDLSQPTPRAVSQAPRANWYVRPASGGQFGPATSGIFVQWLIEQRVAPDSFVWREGWDDWQQAGVALADYFSWKQQRPVAQSALHPSVEPSHAGASSTVVAQPAAQRDDEAVSTAGKPSLSERNRSDRKRRRRRNYLVLISLLILMAIILVVALAIVLSQQTP